MECYERRSSKTETGRLQGSIFYLGHFCGSKRCTGWRGWLVGDCNRSARRDRVLAWRGAAAGAEMLFFCCASGCLGDCIECG